MRLRQLTPLLAVAAVLLTTVPATANETAPPSAAPAATRSVILPTGDRVSLLPGGRHAFEPAAGREGVGYLTPKAQDRSGDFTLIPVDVADEVADGSQDPRRYNVSALLRAGIADAATAPVAALDARPYDGPVPAAAPAEGETRAVTVTVRDKSGGVPDKAWVSVVSADGTVWDGVYLTDTAAGTMELPPGEYGLAADLFDDPEGGRKGTYVAAVRRFTVGAGPLAFTVDGAKSSPVGVRVDRAAETRLRQLQVSWTSGGEEPGSVMAQASLGPDHAMFVASAPADPAVHYAHSETLDGPQGTDYTYRLLFTEVGRIPAKPSRVVHDAELAEVEVDYGGFGLPAPARLCVNQWEVGFDQSPSCETETIDLPFRGTDFYIPGPNRFNLPTVAFRDPLTYATMGYDAAQRSFTAGEHEWKLGSGPLTYGIEPYATEDPEAGASGMYRVDDLLYFGFDQIADGPGGEDNWMYGGGMDDSPLNNVAVITRDGAEINRIEGDMHWFDTGLYPGESGRYRLLIDGHLTAPWSNLLTTSTLDWSFDTAPSGEAGTPAPLPFSLVRFGADGVHGGIADRETPQIVTLDYTSQPGGTEATADALTFEVSYDDGATWTAVALDRDGDHATATLHHPAGAAFVSVRTTATDDLGSAITQTTVRSYSLA